MHRVKNVIIFRTTSPNTQAVTDLIQRGLNTLEAPPPSKPIIVYKENQKMKNLKKGLSVEDQAIADRLEKLHRYTKIISNIFVLL